MLERMHELFRERGRKAGARTSSQPRGSSRPYKPSFRELRPKELIHKDSDKIFDSDNNDNYLIKKSLGVKNTRKYNENNLDIKEIIS